MPELAIRKAKSLNSEDYENSGDRYSELSIKSDLGPRIDPIDRWRFLSPGPFTRTTLEAAADIYGGPLSRDDLADIEAGVYLFEKREQYLRDYLRQWAENHPTCMAELTAETGRDSYGIWAAIAPLDQRGRLIAFAGDPRGDRAPGTDQMDPNQHGR